MGKQLQYAVASALSLAALVRYFKTQGEIGRLNRAVRSAERAVETERQRYSQLQSSYQELQQQKEALERELAQCKTERQVSRQVVIPAAPAPEVKTVVNYVKTNGTILNKTIPSFRMSAVRGGDITELTDEDLKGRYSILLFYPADHNPATALQLGYFLDDAQFFESSYCDLYACSSDSEYSHLAWINTPREKGGLGSSRITMLSDKTQTAIADFGVEDPMNPGRSMFALMIIDTDGVVRYLFAGNSDFGVKSDIALRRVRELSGVKDSYQEESLVVDWASGRHSFIEVSSWTDVASSSPPQTSLSAGELEESELIGSTVTTLERLPSSDEQSDANEAEDNKVDPQELNQDSSTSVKLQSSQADLTPATEKATDAKETETAQEISNSPAALTESVVEVTSEDAADASKKQPETPAKQADKKAKGKKGRK
eukprot:TRINITY_DN7483_c0_g1_i1.p1 TRINITY_DN7483_c0_g1~~TRINITY_DN7483_c0_g1_i1.p1  ORF type:complete len:429 (-),score=100.47 TRINITY_DN7483_c0_g1_i1:230-1516(-)